MISETPIHQSFKIDVSGFEQKLLNIFSFPNTPFELNTRKKDKVQARLLGLVVLVNVEIS